MKIGQELRSQVESTPKSFSNRSNGVQEFQSIMNKEAAQMRESELNRLLEQLTRQGEKVAQFRSFRDLSKYKNLVKNFIQEAVQYGFDLKQSRNWNMQGQNRKLTIVETIDEKLVELTNSVLSKEKNSINILDKIGEIKGLLVNLYT
ncbi:hypothetical protein HNQ94_003721 [Salirhabdus euzebyi]|uniref:DUF327 domain-containing protein n=1 Tax=Salirhabdus euzebyi TaxID=394506 RepID=A0A841QAB4_9BACI|nr:YaaR family protein [Salirhabdus euzebyi]MBB6455224.1 hypothetical protein [Salirhabdus euzebyi]